MRGLLDKHCFFHMRHTDLLYRNTTLERAGRKVQDLHLLFCFKGMKSWDYPGESKSLDVQFSFSFCHWRYLTANTWACVTNPLRITSYLGFIPMLYMFVYGTWNRWTPLTLWEHNSSEKGKFKKLQVFPSTTRRWHCFLFWVTVAEVLRLNT